MLQWVTFNAYALETRCSDCQLQDAGKLLLLSEPIIFSDQPLQLSEESLDGNTKRATSNVPGRSGEVFIPRNAPRPRAGLGLKKTSKKTSIPHAEPVQSGKDAEGKSQDDFRKLLG